MKRNNRSKNDRPIQLEQWIEIRVEGGKAVSTFYPPNNELEQIRQKMDPKPELIYRRFNFVDGVPPEYYWVRGPSELLLYGGHWLQRVLPEEWLLLMAAELNRSGHAAPARYPQPRPEAWGPCPCPACTREREQTPGKSRYDTSSKVERNRKGQLVWRRL